MDRPEILVLRASVAFCSPLGMWVLMLKKKAIATHGMGMRPNPAFRRLTRVSVQWKRDEIQSRRSIGKVLFVSLLMFVVVRLTAEKVAGNHDEEPVMHGSGVCPSVQETEFVGVKYGWEKGSLERVWLP